MLFRNNFQNYGEFEDGNQLPFSKFKTPKIFLDAIGDERFKTFVMPRIKELIKHSMLSAK